MEKPDKDGFINIVWPSKNIPYGGIFHNKVVKPSTSRENFLKLLIEESRLSIQHRQKSAEKIKNYKEQQQRSMVSSTPSVRPRTSKRRSLSAIRESGIYDYEAFKPIKHGEDREKLKERLANIMAYGDVEINESKIMNCKKQNTKLQLPSKKEMKNEIVTQIRERAEWLAEMEYLGEAAPHRDIIKDQIAERIRALDALNIKDEDLTTRSVASSIGKNNIKIVSDNRSVKSSASIRSDVSISKKKASTVTNKEENISAYNGLPQLQCL